MVKTSTLAVACAGLVVVWTVASFAEIQLRSGVSGSVCAFLSRLLGLPFGWSTDHSVSSFCLHLQPAWPADGRQMGDLTWDTSRMAV
jgi:hypothetical protein